MACHLAVPSVSRFASAAEREGAQLHLVHRVEQNVLR